MNIEKEYTIKPLKTSLFYIMMAMGVVFVLFNIACYAFVGELSSSIIFKLMSAVFLWVATVVIVFGIASAAAYKNAFLTCRDDVLTLKFTANQRIKVYSVDLSEVSEYKEEPIGKTYKLVFCKKDNSKVEIPYSEYVYREIRKDILDIIERYSFPKKLACRV